MFQFRSTNAAFQVLRELKSKGTIDSFHETAANATDDFDFAASYESNNAPDNDSNVPSYEYYYEAAQETVPGYKVEYARSNRSQCVKCKKLRQRANKKRNETADTNPRKRVRMTEAEMNEALARNTNIEKNELRVGSLDDMSGTYARWNRLSCWRVPQRVWLGLSQPDDEAQVLRDLIGMDEVLLTGVTALDDDDQARFVEHVMNSGNWAAYDRYKRLKAEEARAAITESGTGAKEEEEEEEDSNPQSDNVASSSSSTTGKPMAVKSDGETKGTEKDTSDSALTAMETEEHEADGMSSAMVTSATSEDAVDVKQREKTRFRIPVPGKNGAIPDCLDGLRFVLTGIFPEVGGGIGLNLGKDKVKKMIEDFGGRVTGSVSGKTNFVIVGKEPGRGKVEAGIPLIDLTSLNNRILGQLPELEDAKPAVIANFSEGYKTQRITY